MILASPSIKTVLPAPGVKLPVPISVSVVVGLAVMPILVVGLVTVDCTMPLLVKLPPSTKKLMVLLDIKVIAVPPVLSSVTFAALT